MIQPWFCKKKTQHFQLSAQELRNRHKRKRKPACFPSPVRGSLRAWDGSFAWQWPQGSLCFSKKMRAVVLQNRFDALNTCYHDLSCEFSNFAQGRWSDPVDPNWLNPFPRISNVLLCSSHGLPQCEIRVEVQQCPRWNQWLRDLFLPSACHLDSTLCSGSYSQEYRADSCENKGVLKMGYTVKMTKRDRDNMGKFEWITGFGMRYPLC